MNNKHSIKNSISSTKKEFFLSIQARMRIFFGLLFAIMLVIVGLSIMYGIPFTPFKGEYRQHKSVALQKISLVANLKKDSLLLWMKERRGDAEALSESGEIRSCVKELSTAIRKYNASGINGDSLWTNVQNEKSYRYLVQRMNLIKDIYGAYNRIRIADASTGLIIASTHNEELGTDITNQDFFHNALQPGVREIIDIDNDLSAEEFYLYISRSINFEDAEQKNIAVIIMHINPDDFIRPMLHTGGGLGKTGEAILVNQDARILTSLKYPLADGSTAKLLEYKMIDKPAMLAAHGEQGMTVSVDYRGEPVLAAYRHIRITSELGWGLVVKTDKAEALVAIKNDKISFIIISLACVLLVVGLVTLIANRISRPIRKLTQTAQQVEKGNFNVHSSVTTSDEIGVLSRMFNSMIQRINERTAEIKTMNESLEQRIAKRTAELTKANEELLKMQKLESVGVLAGGIAHDFNNNLQSILSYVTLAKSYANPEDEVQEKLEEVKKLIFQSKSLTQQLLTFSKGGEPVKNTISISKLIKDSASLSLSGSNIRCELVLPDCDCLIEADKGQMNQVFNNLFINADHAMQDGGNIRVWAENINVVEKDLLPVEEGNYVKITIKDHGTGIPQKHLQKIFDPYFSTKQKGSGLGLATTYSIIKKHDGHIDVESEVGVGTVFHIYLPASRLKTQKTPTPSKAEGVRPEYIGGKEASGTLKGKVLLMEDEDIIKLVVTQHLRNLEYEVETAEEGSKAIELYNKAIETGKPFNAVIMDLTIPGGMGGKETIERLLEIDPEVMAIVTSGYANDPIMAEFNKYGFSGVLAKPYEIDELDETLQKVIMGNS
jgi:signal transduction histidine kinase/CheY-like chemotaxis protein